MCKMKVDFEKLSVMIMGMSDSQVGKYVRLMTAQAVLGKIMPETFKGICGSDVFVAEKFLYKTDAFYLTGGILLAETPKRVGTPVSKVQKTEYGEFVSLKAEEYQTLCDRFGKKATDKMIEVLDNYKGSSGRKYKSDYRAILVWVAEKVKKEQPKLFEQVESYNPTSNPF